MKDLKQDPARTLLRILLSISTRDLSQILQDFIKILVNADDITGILKDEESLKVFLDVMKSYEKVSGLMIDISKCECMWIGASHNCKREVLGLKWPKHPIKCLGVYLTYDYDEFIKLNYKQCLKKMEDMAT